MVRVRSSLFVAAVAVASWSFAADVIAPNSSLKADGVPPIPAELAAKIAPYTEFKPATVTSWHPEKRELIVARRAGNVTQLHLVSAPGAEQRQVYRLDSANATPVLLTDERRKNDPQEFTHARDRLLIAITDVDATGKR